MEEKQLFKSLHNSTLGKELVAYLERVEGDIYDSRQWSENETADTARHAARTLRKKVIDKIKLQTVPKKTDLNTYS